MKRVQSYLSETGVNIRDDDDDGVALKMEMTMKIWRKLTYVNKNDDGDQNADGVEGEKMWNEFWKKYDDADDDENLTYVRYVTQKWSCRWRWR